MCGLHMDTSLLSKLSSSLIFLVGSAILHKTTVVIVCCMLCAAVCCAQVLLEKILPLSATFLGGSIKCQLFVMVLTW